MASTQVVKRFLKTVVRRSLENGDKRFPSNVQKIVLNSALSS
jgi:hypothetical protein